MSAFEKMLVASYVAWEVVILSVAGDQDTIRLSCELVCTRWSDSVVVVTRERVCQCTIAT